jgi:hypothetical protein
VAPDGLAKQLVAYGKIFHLNRASASVVKQVETWLDNWDVTRICCGAQMSKTWRAHLHALNGTEMSAMAPNTHICQSYDYVQLEKNLSALEIPMYGVKLTTVGSCDCSIEKTIKQKLAFNSPEYVPCKSALDDLTARVLTEEV